MLYFFKELDQQRLEIEDNKQRLDETQEKSDPSVTARKHWYRQFYDTICLAKTLNNILQC